MTDYDILTSSLVLVRCLAKRKRTSSEKIRVVLFHYFGTISVKEDRETGFVVQKPCLFMRESRSVQLDSRSAFDFVARAT